MCLAVPMEVVEIDGHEAVCGVGGVRRRVSLFMIQHEEPQVGDHVLVHVGYAIQKVSREDALETHRMLDALAQEERDALKRQQEAQKKQALPAPGGKDW